MKDITKFIEARLTEEETAALECMINNGEWHEDSTRGDTEVRAEGDDWVCDTATERHAAHIALQDPAATLRRCTALRAVIEEVWIDDDRIEGEWGSGQSRENRAPPPAALMALASTWSWHPDFDQAWVDEEAR